MRRSACPLLLLRRRLIRHPPAAISRPLARYPPSSQARSCASCPPPSTSSNVSLSPDHRTIATAQQLFTTSHYSPGSPLFLPHGTRIYNKLIEFLRSQYALHGFQEVLSPNMYKQSLWETSGHWENFKEDMYEVRGRGASEVRDGGGTVEGGEEKGKEKGKEKEEEVVEEEVEEEEGYGLKPMNCPGHCLMFKATAGGRSLRDLPVRYADFSPLHRNENSGSLSGLTRVRRFHQDDGHIFCRPIQIAQEISATLRFIETAYKVFHLPTPELVFSTRPKNYIGDLEEWDRAEAALRQSLEASGQPWSLSEGDGAFYGPKIDIMIADSDGKKHQTATIQLDFQLPRRFGLEYAAPAPASEQKGIVSEDPAELSSAGSVTPVIIHRAVMGSLERFMALLIEHYDGRWPFWLSPRQAIVIPVAMTDEIVEYAQAAQETISGVVGKESGEPQPMGRRTFHVDVDMSTNSLSKKVRAAKTNRYNHIIVVGERNVEANTVSVEAAIQSRLSDEQLAGVQKSKSKSNSNSKPKPKPIDMTPAEVYNHFLGLEDRYA